MKKIILFLTMILSVSVYKTVSSQTVDKADSLGLPGDNLNLYAVLDLFQKCETFEEFEKKLNQEDSKINNLDLNNDKKTDYIRVIDNKDGDNHAVVLQVPVSEKENQDVAVIEIEKGKSGNYSVQIVGNEELYGKDYIIEPKENDTEKKQAIKKDPNVKSDTTVGKDGKTVVVNNYYTTNNYNNQGNSSPDVVYVSVNYWPIVHYMYGPSYVVYVSPWYWYSYPVWWHPWSPWFWHDYYWHHYHHYHHYHYWYHHAPYYRNMSTHTYYGQRRMSSAVVKENRTKGVYGQTYNAPVKTKPKNINPAYKPSAKPHVPAHNNYNKPAQKQDYNKPKQKPNYNKPAQKPQYNKPVQPMKPSPQPSKPQPRPNVSKPQMGGKKR